MKSLQKLAFKHMALMPARFFAAACNIV